MSSHSYEFGGEQNAAAADGMRLTPNRWDKVLMSDDVFEGRVMDKRVIFVVSTDICA